MKKQQYCVVYVTAPQGKVARRMAEGIVKSKTAACVNIVSAVQSIYRWQGKVERAGESLLIIKTRTSLLKKLETVVRKLHPYSVPEIIALPISFGHKPYLAWLGKETKA